MSWKRALCLVSALGACASQLAPRQPPGDLRERRRAEAGACARGVLPAWLDDAALTAAIRLDEREAQASTANESFHGATFSPQPPPAGGTGPRTAAVLRDRQEFQEWCAAIRAARERGAP